MIAVDTSALMAILLRETEKEACSEALAKAERRLISASTVTEALIVAAQRNLGEEMQSLLSLLDWEVVSVTEAAAQRAAAVHGRWGKGVHPAGLNFGDCFAYELAKTMNCPLLYVGDDFSRTDIESAI